MCIGSEKRHDQATDLSKVLGRKIRVSSVFHIPKFYGIVRSQYLSFTLWEQNNKETEVISTMSKQQQMLFMLNENALFSLYYVYIVVRCSFR